MFPRVRANKPGLRDTSLCQKPVRLLGECYMLVVSYTLRLLTRLGKFAVIQRQQQNAAALTQRPNNGNGGVTRVTCSLRHYSFDKAVSSS